jgi:ferritin-like metal-binding protein YciE
MTKAASSPNLRTAFMTHLEQTKEHLSRLDAVLEEVGEKPGRKFGAAEEAETDQRLTNLAEGEINPKALSPGEDDDESKS